MTFTLLPPHVADERVFLSSSLHQDPISASRSIVTHAGNIHVQPGVPVSIPRDAAHASQPGRSDRGSIFILSVYRCCFLVVIFSQRLLRFKLMRGSGGFTQQPDVAIARGAGAVGGAATFGSIQLRRVGMK